MTPTENEWVALALKLEPGDLIEYHFHGDMPTLCIVLAVGKDAKNEEGLDLKTLFPDDKVKRYIENALDGGPCEDGMMVAGVQGMHPHKLLKRVQRSD